MCRPYAQGYDSSAYGGAAAQYGQQQAPPPSQAPPAGTPVGGAYGQAQSSFGPSRGGVAKPGGGYHPYGRGR